MKIEASEGAYGEGGAVVCSVPELLPPIAQDGQASIGPRLQQQPGCGPAAFDCEHFQFIDDDDSDEETPPALPAMSGLKSLLKRGRSGHGRSVTFDEAVTLYCDDGEGVQLLQLTTGPDIVAAAEAYYGMFEPPIEYQDIEPPAEYRDSDDPPEPAPAVEDPPPPPEEEEVVMVVEKVEVEVVEPPTKQQEEVEVVDEVVEEEEDPLPSPNESDKLIERFLEAEGVFPVDEELNSVFRELHSDFIGDGGQNGALDDTLFRNLISFLSNAEEIPLEAGDFFSTTKFEEEDVTPTASQEAEEDGTAHSRTLSEADSDCSISSQDTIIVRLGEEEGEQQQSERGGKVAERVKAFESQAAAKPIPEPRLHKQESLDEVFSDRSAEVDSSRPVQSPPRPLPRESIPQKILQQQQQVVGEEESLSRQSSGEASVTDPTPADADDSTSSDSRSGEVEEEIRLDDIGYDEEDADDYDEESFRGMAHGNSKIRRIIKKNALQCTLFRGIEAKRRQQPGIKYPRPKSPLLSQESLVEKLKWLTTVDEPKEGEGGVNFHSKPPDVILSTGGIPVNGSIPHGGPEDNNVHNPSAMPYPQQFYQMQRFAMTPNAKGGYYVRHDGYHPSLPRPRMAGGACPGGHPMPPPPPGWRMMAPWAAEQQQQQQPQQQQNRSLGSLTVPRNFRDWRVIQRVMVGRSSDQQQQARTGVDYVRCAPVVATSNGPRTRDELEQFVEQDSQRLDRIRKRYSVAEDDDDPTFGFARRPSVRGVQQGRSSSIHTPSEQPPIPEEGRYGTWGGYRGPMHIHRASVALTELPGNATIPYAHRKHPDPRYHSYAESMYGSTRTLPAKTWDPRMLQMVPPPPPAKDERGVPEGASSSPKISSDSLYHSPVVPDPMPPGGGAPPHKDEGVIYYSLNV